MDPEERPEKKSKKEDSGGKGTVIRSSFTERTKKKAEDAKKKAREKVLASCSKDEEELPENLKKAAEQYARIRKSSKGRFKWNEQMPDVDEDDRPSVRRYAKANLLPEVPMVTVKDRHGKDIKCPTFPPDTIILELILPKEKWDESDYDQFKYLDEQVKLKGFDAETRMYNGKKYTWHHHQDEGKMQLVENGIHSMTQHSGGREIWAAERVNPFEGL